MKQVNLVAALLLFVLGASAQTVTPDPGPYAPMNQKYEYRWIKTSGGIWNLGKLIVQDSTDLRSVTYVTTAPDNDSSKRVASTAWVKKNITAGGGGIDSVRRKGVTDSIVEYYGGALGFRRFAFIAPATSGSDTTGTGNLYIRNITTQENKRFNVKGGRLDSLYASTSGGGKIVSNGGTVAAEWGAGGGANFDFHGFAGYNDNRASSYTARSFTDKNYVDSSLTLKTTVSSYGKNAGGDSTILLLSNGTRYAAKDSVGGGGASGWSLTGNAGTNASTNFVGTTDNVALRFKMNNVASGNIDSLSTNTSFGFGSSANITSGSGNTSVGYKTLNKVTTANSNTAFGSSALSSVLTSNSNTAFGNGALRDLVTGSSNTGIGLGALIYGTSYSSNVGIGSFALANANQGDNIAIGANAAQNLTSGQYNLAIGSSMMQGIVTGSYNSGIGVSSLLALTSGNQNSGYGNSSLQSLTTGNNNTAVGRALQSTTTGSNNIGIGWTSGFYNTTESNQLYISSLFFADLAASKSSSIIYGVQNATTANQTLTFNASVGINQVTPAASAVLDIVSTTKGLLIPRMTLTQRDAIATPATALQIFSTTDSTNYIYRGTTSKWQATITGIRGSGTLDFGSTSAQTSAELTITVTGAADGDVVSVSPLNAAYNANTNYTARVSAANTVSVAFNNFSAAAVDPASAVFKVVVFK